MPAGRTLGQYQILEEIARGGMGAVFKAYHPGLQRAVALKVLLGEGSPEERERFQVEARAAARLEHPAIVGIHAVGEHLGRPFLVMDLIEGESLRARLRRDGPLGCRPAAELSRQDPQQGR